MNSCQIKWLGKSEVAISGVIDEYADFSDLAKHANKILTVDFGKLTRMNSSGVRNWSQIVIRNHIELVLRNCSSVLIEQLAMVTSILGNKGRVESFFVNYHCLNCDYGESKLLYVGKDIQISEHPTVEIRLAKPCPKCGEAVEIEHTPDIYLSFLRKPKVPLAP